MPMKTTRRGRPQALGALVVDKERGYFGYNAGNCNSCGTKHLLDRDQLTLLASRARKEQKSLAIRVARLVMASRTF